MDDKKQVIDIDEAIALLPKASMVHTFRQTGWMLLGAHMPRDKLIAAMRAAVEVEITGANAQASYHGLAIVDDLGFLFIETKKQEKL